MRDFVLCVCTFLIVLRALNIVPLWTTLRTAEPLRSLRISVAMESAMPPSTVSSRTKGTRLAPDSRHLWQFLTSSSLVRERYVFNIVAESYRGHRMAYANSPGLVGIEYFVTWYAAFLEHKQLQSMTSYWGLYENTEACLFHPLSMCFPLKFVVQILGGQNAQRNIHHWCQSCEVCQCAMAWSAAWSSWGWSHRALGLGSDSSSCQRSYSQGLELQRGSTLLSKCTRFKRDTCTPIEEGYTAILFNIYLL